MNTVIDSNGKIEIKKPMSKAGDKKVLTVIADCVLGISVCSASECDANSGICTAIAMCVE